MSTTLFDGWRVQCTRFSQGAGRPPAYQVATSGGELVFSARELVELAANVLGFAASSGDEQLLAALADVGVTHE